VRATFNPCHISNLEFGEVHFMQYLYWDTSTIFMEIRAPEGGPPKIETKVAKVFCRKGRFDG